MNAVLLGPVLAAAVAGCSAGAGSDAATPYGSSWSQASAGRSVQGAVASQSQAPARLDAGGRERGRGLVLQQVAAVLARVSGLRQLPPRGPVEGRTVDRATMLRQVKEQVRRQVPSEAVRGESDFLKAFGFLPPKFDYEAGIYALIENQLAGYFDPASKTVFLMVDLAANEAEVTLAHELVHALQDQHHDLDRGLRYSAGANDRQSALHCLAEGDATSVMLDYTLAPAGRTALSLSDDVLRAQISAAVAVSEELGSFPSILRRSLLAPYIDGLLLVHALRRRGGWAAVDAVWDAPPQTTEQVLHVDKLDAREPAEALAAPDAGGFEPGFVEAHRDTYGEQGLRTALEEWMPRRQAESAAAGWAGDRATVLARRVGGARDVAAAWHIRFDLAAGPRARGLEAAEAFNLIAQAWRVQPTVGETACHTVGDGRVIGLALRGRDLGMVAASIDASDLQRTGQRCAAVTRWAIHVARAR